VLAAARVPKISSGRVFSVGDKVGDYEIVAKLKAGGMATLFLGRRGGAAGFSRHVAIKVVHEHLAADDTFVQMFVDEALLSSKIHHPNVVHVEELRKVDGRYFLVMEYVHGCALSALLNALRRQKRTFAPELATHVACEVAAGLHAAHEATDADGSPLGVVHRDVSPQNVLLSYKGHVKLIDFGVAKAAGRATQTTGGSLKGKIRYMAPEQAFGRPVDRRADVYALGVVLWEMLTGRRAFTADNELALLEKVRHPDVPPAREHSPSVPEALDAVIRRAMAEDPADRFASCKAMRKALAKAVPAALALDDSDLSHLLGHVMGDTIERDLAALPESVSGVAPPTLHADEEALLTLTVSAPGLSSEPSSKVSLPPPPPPAPVATVVDAELRSAPADPASRGPRPAMVASAVLFGLLAIGATLGAFWALRGAEPDDAIRATELDRPSPDEPATVASPADDAGRPDAGPADTPPERAVDAAPGPADVTSAAPRRGRRAPARRRARPRGRRGATAEEQGSGSDVLLTEEF